MAKSVALVRALLVAALLSLALPAHAQALRTIFLVRHAEKVSSAPDALLSAAGHVRAECLARTLGDAGIRNIYATDVRRTQQTAQPLADRLKLAPVVIPKSDMSGLVAKLRAGTGDPALVVAHQDTLPKIIATLGGGEIKPIADNQFDQLFVIILDGAKARLMTLHYCDGGGPAPAADKSQGMRPQP